MPHRPVYRQNRETTKLRIVFNASSHISGVESLNDLLHTGPNMNTPSLVVTLNFRSGNTAVISDIEKAFLQISLDEKDWNSHRFLWYSDVNDLDSLIVLCMTRVTFGVKSSPFLLAAVLYKIFKENKDVEEAIADRILSCFYVDDFIISEDDVDLLIKICSIVKDVGISVSMNFRKWATNNEKLQLLFKNENNLSPNRKVLGLVWNTDSDDIRTCRILERYSIINEKNCAIICFKDLRPDRTADSIHCVTEALNSRYMASKIRMGRNFTYRIKGCILSYN